MSSAEVLTSYEYALMDKREILSAIIALTRTLDTMESIGKDHVSLMVRRDGQRLTVYASSAFVMDVVLTDERIRGAMV